MAISTLRKKRARPTRLIGEPAKRARKAASSSAASSASGGIAPVRGDELRLAADAREFVPGADRQAIVAAIDAVADAFPQFPGNRPLMLDRQIGDATARVQLIRRRKGAGRAGVEAGAADSAVVALGRVRPQVEIGEQRAEEKPGAEIAADEIGVLALPTEARGLRQRLLHHRRGVDEHFDLAAGCSRQPRSQLLEPAFQHVVIVAMAGIDGDGAVARLGGGGEGIAVGRIIDADHHAGAGFGPKRARAGAAWVLHPRHVAVTAQREPVSQPIRGAFGGRGRRNAAGVEAKLRSFGLQRERQTRGGRHCALSAQPARWRSGRAFLRQAKSSPPPPEESSPPPA